METTRFYYCDGAAEEYLKEHMIFSSEENYFENIKGLIKSTNSTIRIMMQVYIDLKLKKKF